MNDIIFYILVLEYIYQNFPIKLKVIMQKYLFFKRNLHVLSLIFQIQKKNNIIMQIVL